MSSVPANVEHVEIVQAAFGCGEYAGQLQSQKSLSSAFLITAVGTILLVGALVALVATQSNAMPEIEGLVESTADYLNFTVSPAGGAATTCAIFFTTISCGLITGGLIAVVLRVRSEKNELENPSNAPRAGYFKVGPILCGFNPEERREVVEETLRLAKTNAPEYTPPSTLLHLTYEREKEIELSDLSLSADVERLPIPEEAMDMVDNRVTFKFPDANEPGHQFLVHDRTLIEEGQPIYALYIYHLVNQEITQVSEIFLPNEFTYESTLHRLSTTESSNPTAQLRIEATPRNNK